METYQTLRLLKQKLEERSAQLGEATAQGKVSDWDEYKLVTGQILGIKTALMFIQELNKSLDEDDR